MKITLFGKGAAGILCENSSEARSTLGAPSPSRDVGAMRIAPLLVALFVVACGAEAAQAPRAKTEAKAPPPKPRCPPEADPQPSDAEAKMNALQAGIRQCMALGTNSKSGVGVISLRLVVSEAGDVQKVDIEAEGAQPSSTECIEKVARGTKFARFCGDAASIAWKYTVN